MVYLSQRESYRRRPKGSRGPGHPTQESGTEIVQGNLEIVTGRDAHRATAQLWWMPTPSPVLVPQPASTESSPETAHHRTSHRRSITMPNKLRYVTPLLAAVTAAVIGTAPTAAADAAPTRPTAVAAAPAAVDPTQSICMSLGGSKAQCQTPGNVEINDSGPPVHYKPQWNDRYLGDPIPPYPTA
jgi:hypothetical protein